MDWTELDYHVVNLKIEATHKKLKFIAIRVARYIRDSKKHTYWKKQYEKVNDQLFIMEEIKELRIKQTALNADLETKQREYADLLAGIISENVGANGEETKELSKDQEVKKTLLETEIDSLQAQIKQVKNKIILQQRDENLGLWD